MGKFGDMSNYQQYFNVLKTLGVFPYETKLNREGQLSVSWYSKGPWLWISVSNFSIILMGLMVLYIRFILALLSPKELSKSDLIVHILWTSAGTWALFITLLNIRKRKSLCVILTRVCHLELKLGKCININKEPPKLRT